MASITVEEGNNTYDSRNNCNAIIETATNKLIVGCKSTVIPDNVTTIGYKAFKGCSFKLTSITIPESVTMIEAEAFVKCLELSIIYVRAKNPPILNMSDDWRYPFYYPSITKIYVPQESLETYHYDEGWSNYWDKIEGYNFE